MGNPKTSGVAVFNMRFDDLVASTESSATKPWLTHEPERVCQLVGSRTGTLATKPAEVTDEQTKWSLSSAVADKRVHP